MSCFCSDSVSSLFVAVVSRVGLLLSRRGLSSNSCFPSQNQRKSSKEQLSGQAIGFQ